MWLFMIGCLCLTGTSEALGASSRARPDSMPPFTLEQRGERWWIVSPEGNPFVSKGICVLTQGTSREYYDNENPSYAGWRYYSTSQEWATSALRRLKELEFTTLGAWADLDILRRSSEQTFYLTPVLHMGSTAGAPWWDMWDSRNIQTMDDVARPQILAVRDDPRLMGYYSDNELGWWNASLWKMTLEQPSTSGQKKRLIQLLRDTYGNDWKRLQNDFEVIQAENWAQLKRGGMLFLRPGGNGIHVMRAFLGILADRYYQLMCQTIRKYDQRALYLGDRYQSFYYPEVALASARYVDAASSNLNATWSDGTFVRCYLDTLHALTHKPVLVTEIYAAAKDNRSGNRNTQGIYPVVSTQAERAESARRTLNSVFGLPFVVGADWFQYFDEPRHGRHDGENFNFGLVDIDDKPYVELGKVFAALTPDQIKKSGPTERSDASRGVPRGPLDPFAHFESTHALEDWNREDGFVKPSTDRPLADLYLCWSSRAVYLGIFAFDFVEPAYYSGASVPKADRSLWSVQVDRGEVLRARIGGGLEPLVSNPDVRIENLSGVNLSVRNIAILEMPVSLLNRTELKPGDTIDLDVSLVSHARALRVEWRGSFRLRD